MKRLGLATLMLLMAGVARAQVINCPNGFSTSGSCAVSGNSGGSGFWVGPNLSTSQVLSGTQAKVIDTGVTHVGNSMNYQTKVDVRSFNTTFKFIPNGQNIIWMVQNSSNNPYFNGAVFANGAGCEADFFQGYSQPNPPNNVFALELDSYSQLTSGANFTYSSAQIYPSNPYVMCPCMGGPGICGDNNSDPGNHPKISTSPVPLNSPANKQNSTTGDIYAANLVYDGSNLTLNLYDESKGGSCPGSTCFTKTWNSVDVPASVGGNVAWVGVGGSTGIAGISPLTITSMVYSEGTLKPPTPTATATATSTATSTATATAMPTPSTKCSFTDGTGRVWTWACN